MSVFRGESCRDKSNHLWIVTCCHFSLRVLSLSVYMLPVRLETTENKRVGEIRRDFLTLLATPPVNDSPLTTE